MIVIMSQKVAIERVQVRGAAPYLGMSTTEDGQQGSRADELSTCRMAYTS